MIDYQEIGDDSVYKEKADATYGIVKKAYVKDHLSQARQALASHDCEQVRMHVEAALIVDESNTEAQEIARKCGPPLLPPPVDHGRIAPVDYAALERGPSAPTEADQLVSEAQDDYVNGRNVHAIETARMAIHRGATTKAYRIIGAAACNQKDRDEVMKAWRRLGDMDRRFVKYICARNNLEIP